MSTMNNAVYYSTSAGDARWYAAAADEQLLSQAIRIAYDYYHQGWRLSVIQFATAERAEYAHIFADPSPDGVDDWDPIEDPWDDRLWAVSIFDERGERSYRWDRQSQRFVRDDGSAVVADAVVEEATEEI